MIVGFLSNKTEKLSNTNKQTSPIEKKPSMSLASSPSKDVFTPSFSGKKQTEEEVSLKTGKTKKLNNIIQKLAFKTDLDGRCEFLKGEVDEFNEAVKTKDRKEVISEFGDILYNVIALADMNRINIADALKDNTKKISSRLNLMEKLTDKPLSQCSKEECINLWAKAKEKLEAKKK